MKNQIKKSLSLFLAVLMVLSCWVWVAPEKAEAIANVAEKTKYEVEIMLSVTSNPFESGNICFKTVNKVTGAENVVNGTDGYSTTTKDGSLHYVAVNSLGSAYDIDGNKLTAVGKHIYRFSSTDFPTVIWVETTGGSGKESDGNRSRMEITYIKINGKQVCADAGEGWYMANHFAAYPTNQEGSTGNGKMTYSWPLPAKYQFIDTEESTPINISLNKIGGADIEKGATFNEKGYTWFDQYDVRIASDFARVCPLAEETTHIAKSKNSSSAVEGEIAEDISANGSNVKVKSHLQVSNPKPTEGKDTFYLVKTYTYNSNYGTSVSSRVSVPINVTYPDYNVNFNGAGSVPALNYTMDMNSGAAKSTTHTEKGPYNKVFADYPKGTASAKDANGNDAYTFKGFWTEPQPTTGNASFNAIGADFAGPISNEKFDEYLADGGVANGKYITYNEKTYYNAGTAWDTKNNKISNDMTYYGWWLSKDITVKFYDIDGSYLGTVPVKYGQKHSDISWPQPSESFSSGAFEYSNFTGVWENIDGTEVNQTNCTFTCDLILTPKYKVSFDNKYSVTFKDTNGNNITGSSTTYDYRADLGALGVIPADRAVPNAISSDKQFSYEFVGWAEQVPSSGSYHIILEDSDFDETGMAVTVKDENSDWIVRDDATYYPVFRRHIRTYVVKFWYKDSTGAEASREVTVTYGDQIKAPIDYVPYTYATQGYEYPFAKWEYRAANNSTASFDYDSSVIFTEENFNITLDAVADGDSVKPIYIDATYGTGIPKPYNVTFKYKDAKGEDVTKTFEVKHGDALGEELIAALTPAAEYDNGEALVSYNGAWAVLDGAADKTQYDVSELALFGPTSHITFEAIYGNPKNFYTVTYIDGTNTFSERVLVGDNVPAWTIKTTNDNETPDDTSDDFEEDVAYEPKMADTAQGYYVFQGWFNEKQTDTSYTVTNGTKIDTTAIVSDNLTLYPQFKFEPFTYTIKFMDYTGKVQLAAGEFKYGQSIAQVASEATVAAQGRAQDDTYKYEFIGWDKEVPAFCEGSDMTFIAQYKTSYRYYQAKWYNSVLVDGNWVPDTATDTDGKETALLATTKHIYDTKVNSPSVSANCAVTPSNENETYVFAGWKYKDKDGNEHDYVRGMKITGDMVFYATYTLTTKAYKVTAVVGDTTVTYDVAASKAATMVPTPAEGYVDAQKHNKFDGWFTTAEFTEGTEFDINTPITGNIAIYAKLTESNHEFTLSEVVTKPTYYAKGQLKKWCACDSTQAVQTEDIAMLTDTVAPTGTIYLGTQGSWSSTGTPASETDDQDVIYFANADTDLILIINDTGDVSEYNPAGVGKGIKMIRGFISEGVYSQDDQNVDMSEVLTVFEDNTEAQNNSANYVVKLGQYGTLENGKTYVAYYYAIDKAGRVLNENVRTAKFIYDTQAPAIAVEGKSNAGKAGVVTVTYCDQATVTGIEKGAIVTVNGEVVTATYAEGAVTGTYKITTPGYHMITVADQAGNKTSKKIYVADDHDYIVKEVLSTCTEDGYKMSTCSVCGDEKEKEIYKATDHVWESTHVSSTCEENGYALNVCELCGEEVKTYTYTVVEDGVEKEVLIDPAHGHIYDRDPENSDPETNIIYTLVTEATCKTKGKEIATCKACGETIERPVEIPSDVTKQNHNWGSVRTLKATCTAAGKEYKICGLCGVQETVKTLPATGHEETQWVVTTAATCGTAGTETLQCKKCKTLIGDYDIGWYAGKDTDWSKLEKILDEDGNPIVREDEYNTFYKCYKLDENGVRIFNYQTREIPATGRHILAVSEDPTKTFDATAEADGQITRYCTQCGQEWVEKVAKIEKYTVKFVDEDGTTEIATFNKIAGETIAKDSVTEPTKANSADGKFKYTFTGWKDENGKSVTLPFDVTGNVTLKATYAQANIIYTHQFMVPNTWVAPLSEEAPTYTEFATMMGAMGDERKPVAEPAFSLLDEDDDAELKKLYTFKFLGWSTTGAEGDITTNFTIAGDATFYAVFEAVAIRYQVIYYNGTEYVWDTVVDGGATVTFGGTLPKKAYDDDKHYEFDKWYTDATLKTAFAADTAITATTRLYAGFTGENHNWAVDTDKQTIPATCTTPEYKFEKCYDENCGATRMVVGADALSHKPGTPETIVEDGVYYSVIKCTVCGEETSRTKTSVTITFRNYNDVRVDTLNLNVGEQIVFETIPTRPDDGEFTYTFAGWYVDGDETQTVVTLGTAEKDVTYIAKYTATKLTFRVTYVDSDNNTLYTVANIVYGSAIPEFVGTEPSLDYDDFYHYEFDGWDVEADATVTTNLVISPVFAREEHNYVKQPGSSDATCTTPGGGDDYKCSECESSYTEKATIPALGHKVVETSRDAYDYIGGKAYIYYTCERNCGEEITPELIKCVEFTKALTINGAPIIDGTVVELYKDGVSVAVKAVANGEVTFYIYEKGTYEIKYAGQTLADATVNNKLEIGSTTQTPVEPSQPDDSCSCTCHEGTFWGILFRLFHKLIKLFTGKIGCCSCPDGRY